MRAVPHSSPMAVWGCSEAHTINNNNNNNNNPSLDGVQSVFQAVRATDPPRSLRFLIIWSDDFEPHGCRADSLAGPPPFGETRKSRSRVVRTPPHGT